MSEAADRPDDQPTRETPTRETTESVRDPLRRSKASGAWLSVAGLGLVLLLLIIFILQNTQSVEVSFLGWDGHAPLAVSLLVAALAGLFVALIAGSLRIIQLRRRVRRTKR